MHVDHRLKIHSPSKILILPCARTCKTAKMESYTKMPDGNLVLIQQTVYKQVSAVHFSVQSESAATGALELDFYPIYLNVQTWILAYSIMKIYIKEICTP